MSRPLLVPLCLVAALLTGACAQRPAPGAGLNPDTVVPRLTPVDVGTTERLQAVVAVDDQVAWASGTGGTVIRTANGGTSWEVMVVPGASELEFRDIAAFDSLDAYVLAAGPGDRSRIFRTTDGGRSWALQFINDNPGAFYDCFGFWDRNNGLAFSDAYDSVHVLLQTTDGQTWQPHPAHFPLFAIPGEGGFAASGTCLIARDVTTAYVATGASGKAARVFRTTDRGTSWEVAATPVVHDTPTSGLTSIAFTDSARGLAVGGDLSRPQDTLDVVAVTTDGGNSWSQGGRLTFPGAAYVVAQVRGLEATFVAAGPNGASWSHDLGATWTPLDTLNYWGGDFSSPGTGWLVGPGGRVTKVSFAAAVR